MLDDFLVRAAFAGIGLSLATGPLGAFVVWRRMAYFGDTIAHAAILGVAMSLAFSMSVFVGTLAIAVLVGLSASGLAQRGRTMDSALGVLSYTALALGLVAFSFIGGPRIDLSAFLFGDILTVSSQQLAYIWGGSIIVLAMLIWRWSSLLTATLNEELAASAGIDPNRERIWLILALAIVVALSLKIVGALLIGAMLIIPASAAQGVARTPEIMAGVAILVGMIASLVGVMASVITDAPAGPAIVVAAAIGYGFSLMLRTSEK